jgi:hypothetical protein
MAAGMNATAAEVQMYGKVLRRYTGAIRALAFELPTRGSKGTKQQQVNTKQVLAQLRKRADVAYIVQNYRIRALGATGECCRRSCSMHAHLKSALQQMQLARHTLCDACILSVRMLCDKPLG